MDHNEAQGQPRLESEPEDDRVEDNAGPSTQEEPQALSDEEIKVSAPRTHCLS